MPTSNLSIPNSIVAALASIGWFGSWVLPVTPSDEPKPAQLAYLKASNTGASDSFGDSLAASGNTIVVGARREDGSSPGVNGNPFDNTAQNAGAVYAFVRNGSTWSLEAYLKASTPDVDDEFGTWVAIDGDTLVVGAPEEDSAAIGINGDESDNSSSRSGCAYVFVRTGTDWTQQAYLKASNTDSGDIFGRAVALSGDTIVVGALSEDSSAQGVNGPQNDNAASGSGAAYVFVRVGTTWTQQAYLKASNADSGDAFGIAVAVSGDTIVVGASSEDSASAGVNGDMNDNSLVRAGAAYVFARSGTTWSQQAYLKPSNPGFTDRFGDAVTISGDTIAVGAPLESSTSTGVGGGQGDGASSSGAAYVFRRSGAQWSQEAYVKAMNTDPQDQFGDHLALSGDLLLVSAPFEDGAGNGLGANPGGNANSNAGAAYVYRRTGTAWTPTTYVKASNSDPLDRFGTQVAVAGKLAVCGAPFEDSASTEINNVGAPDMILNFDGGAAYAFEFPDGPFSYCVAKTNSEGCTPTVEICGSSSQGALDPLIFETPLVPGDVSGLLFYGTSAPAELPFLGGALCVRPPLKRTPMQNSGGVPTFPCDGLFSFDFTGWISSGNDPLLGVGSAVFAQFWYRDDGDPDRAGLTNAVQFSIEP